MLAMGELAIDGVIGIDLHGRCFSADARSGVFIVIDADRQIGSAAVSATPGRDATFIYRLPTALYDGKAHELSVRAGAGHGTFNFIGDPKLVRPA